MGIPPPRYAIHENRLQQRLLHPLRLANLLFEGADVVVCRLQRFGDAGLFIFMLGKRTGSLRQALHDMCQAGRHLRRFAYELVDPVSVKPTRDELI